MTAHPTPDPAALFRRVDDTRAEHERQQSLLARGHVKSTADWRCLLTAKAEYEAALAEMAAHAARHDPVPAAGESEAA